MQSVSHKFLHMLRIITSPADVTNNHPVLQLLLLGSTPPTGLMLFSRLCLSGSPHHAADSRTLLPQPEATLSRSLTSGLMKERARSRQGPDSVFSSCLLWLAHSWFEDRQTWGRDQVSDGSTWSLLGPAAAPHCQLMWGKSNSVEPILFRGTFKKK